MNQKIFLLADCNSIHTQRWAFALATNGFNLCIFSIGREKSNIFERFQTIKIISCNSSIENINEGAINKIEVLKFLPKVKAAIKHFNPDIVHAHYATSYGLLGALSGFKPFIISVWGSDIFDFPNISIFHNWLIKFNLYRANKILSTSNIMAEETRKYTNKEVIVTPFGIDLTKFKNKKVNNLFSDESITIGTVKTLLPKYGIDYLIHAFKIVKAKHIDLPLKLLIVGGGRDKLKLENLCEELRITNDVIFTGAVDYDKVPDFLNNLDIYVALSTLDSESFGVAIIEASACEKPVVVSNVGGLPEVVENGKTGFVVEAKNPQAAAQAIEKLVLNKELRIVMGKTGRMRVQKLYNWDENVKFMVEIYEDILK